MPDKIGLDTNVAFRWLFNDSGADAQSALAGDAVRTRAGTIHVNLVVLVELVWLVTKSKKIGRAELVLLIRDLLDNPSVEVTQHAVVTEALAAFERGGAGFTDHLIAALNRAAGCTTTLTFDQIAAKSRDFTLLA